MTDTKEKKEKPKTIVRVPVSVVISVPIEIDVDIPDTAKTYSEDFECDMVEVSECPEAVDKAIATSGTNEVTGKAFDGLWSAATRFKDHYPEVDIYITPYAGLIPETKF